jgi:biopolymer transport protein ExbD
MTKDENKSTYIINNVLESASTKINKINRSQSELDSKLEKLLKNDLGDSDTDSTFAVDNQSNYQEVFSNSNSSHDSSLNSNQKNEEINKNKFFANYLNI